MQAHVIDTASGRRVDLDAPDPSQICLEDIAGGLSRICRFGAQAVRFHSVAEHAVLVSRLVADNGNPELGLAALHHDSHEAYVCDIPAPLKRKMEDAEQTVYEEVCAALDASIYSSLGIRLPSTDEKTIIKTADDKALMIEAADLLHDRGAGISAATGLPQQPPGQLAGSRDPDGAKRQFHRAHENLLRREADDPGPPSGALAGD